MDYAELYDRMIVTPSVYTEAVKIAILIKAEPRYKAVEAKTGVPAILVGVLHHMESDRNFNRSYFNGDDGLRTRTKIGQPYGQPKHPNPPYTWEQTAIAALEYDGIKAQDEDYGEMCHQAVVFNGTGYEKHHVVSPYGFAGTNLYQRGKFVTDSRYSSSSVSRQIGACVIIKAYENLISEAPPKNNPPFIAVPIKPKEQFIPMVIPRSNTKPPYLIPPTSPRGIPPKVLLPWETDQHKDRTYEPLEPKVRFSKNITNGDLTKGGARPFPNLSVEKCYRELAVRLDSVSDFYNGKKLIVESGHRTEAGNRSVGGAPHSRHTGYYGCAADIIVKGIAPHRVYRDFNSSWQGGMGDGDNFTHFDLRENFTSRWNYDAYGHYIN